MADDKVQKKPNRKYVPRSTRKTKKKKEHFHITDKLNYFESEQFERFVVGARFKKYVYYNRLFEFCRTYYERDPKFFLPYIIKTVRGGCVELMRNSDRTKEQHNEAYSLYKKTLLFAAEDDLDSFMLYMEINVEPRKSFWIPRRDILMPIAKGWQRLVDGDINLFIQSQPPRTGKSGLLSFVIAWVMGKNPQFAKLYVTYGASVSKLMYDRVLTLIQDKTYTYKEIFSKAAEYIDTSAQETMIDLGQANPHKTLATRSIDGSITGVVEAKDFLFLDDLIKDIEEAMKPERLDTAWEKLTSVVFQRLRDGARIGSIGTRWSLNDPNGRLIDIYGNDPKCLVINIPALNENNESNFNFKFGVGFSTEYYLDKKRTMDSVSFAAIYQGEPIEREGLLFYKEDLRLTGTKKEFGDETRRMAVVDVAWGGGDYLSMPCAWIINNNGGDEFHIKDVVFSNKTKEVTQPLVAGEIRHLKLQDIDFEANNGGDEYALNVNRLTRKMGWSCRIKATKAPSGIAKNSRIIQFSPDIKARCVFLKESEWDSDYKAFMAQLLSYNQNGKNKNDDAADSLSMLFYYDKKNLKSTVKVLPPSFKLF